MVQLAPKAGFNDDEIRACVLNDYSTSSRPEAHGQLIACSSERWGDLREKAQEDARQEVLRKGSSEGYGKARWGMSPAQVRKIYPQARTNDGLLTFRDQIERFKATVMFRFVNRHLVAVVVAFDRDQHLPESYAEVNSEIERLLEAKYGAGKSDSDDDGATYWSTGLTEITLKYDPLDLNSTSAILYSSVELAGLKEDLNEKAASSKL